MIGIVVAFVALPLGWLLGVLVRIVRVHNQRHTWLRSNTIYAEYESPGNLRPGEVAYLYDQSFGTDELLATLFDLEARGKVRLTPLPGPDVNFGIHAVGKPIDDSLKLFEQEALAAIAGHKTGITWQDLKADTTIWDSAIESQLKRDLQGQDYVQAQSQPMNTALPFLIGGGLIALASVVIPVISTEPKSPASTMPDDFAGLRHDMDVFTLACLWLGAALLYACALYCIMSAYRHAMDMGKGTGKLRQLWPRLAGFREYLQVVEQDRLQFENTSLRAAALDHTLAYAVALGLSTRWEDRFRNK